MIKFLKANMLICILTVLFAVLFLGSAYFQRIKLLDLYQSGIHKIENQEYREAQEILNELGNYKDSLKYLKFAQTLEDYNTAVDLFNNKDYEGAVELFAKLDGFIFSQEYLNMSGNLISMKEQMETQYNNIDELYEANDFILAIQKILELDNYVKEGQEDLKNNVESEFAFDDYKRKVQEDLTIGFDNELAVNNYIQNLQKDFENAIQMLSNSEKYKSCDEMLQTCQIELAKLQQASTISAGIRSSVGMIKNEKVYLAGNDYYSWKSELESWNDIVSVSVKGNFVVGLKKDGTVVFAGQKPEYYVGTTTWTDIIAISTGQQYIIGLRSDGTLVAQGHNGDGQANIDDWKDIVAISTGWRHTVGLTSEGQIRITGYGSSRQIKTIEDHIDDWKDIVAISAGGGSSGNIGATAYTAALKEDKTVVTTLTGKIADEINQWSDIIAISAGDSHIVGLKSDGTVVTTQTGESADEISQWEDIVAVSAGYGFTLGLKRDGTVVATGYENNGQIDVESWGNITNYKDEWNTIFDQTLRWNGMNK